MQTAVVILNWNTENFLKEFLPALIHSVRRVEGAEVVVADNASTDGSMKLMSEMFPDVPTVSFEKNLGFTGGYNEAFRRIVTNCKCDNKVISHAPEYFLLINSDIEVSDGWLEPLVEWMDTHPMCGACAPKLHSWQQKNMFEYAGAAGGYIDKFGYPFCRGRVMSKLEEDKGEYDLPAEVFWATGACLLVRSSVYSALGGLDNRFFAHMEEIDLCWRMQLEGYSVNVVPSSCVWHVGGGTLPASSPMKLFLNYRNNLLMLSNNLAKTYALRLVQEVRQKYYKTDSTNKNRLNKDELIEIAYRGIRRANFRIFSRMVLDGMSAAVYMLTFKWSSVKAVWKAHNEFRKLRKRPDAVAVANYLSGIINNTIPCDDASDRNASTNDYNRRIKGVYPKWIVFQYLIKGNKIFEAIRIWERNNLSESKSESER